MYYQGWLRRFGFRICCTCCGVCVLLGLSTPFSAPLIWKEFSNLRSGPPDARAILMLIAGLLGTTLLFAVFAFLATLLAPEKKPGTTRSIERPQRRQQYHSRLARFLNLTEATLLHERERGSSRMPFWMRVTNLIRRGPKSPERIRQLLLQIHHTIRPASE